MRDIPRRAALPHTTKIHLIGGKTMATELQKQIKAALEGVGVYDHVTLHHNGSVTLKRNFFYTNGQNSETVKAVVMRKLEQAGIDTGALVIQSSEHWHTWPADSFFAVDIRPAPDALDAHTWQAQQALGGN